MINVALADDHVAMRKGLKYVIEAHPYINVVMEAENGNELLTKLKNCIYPPEVILLDLHMPVMSGQETLGVLKKEWPRIKIIIYSSYSANDIVIDMIRRGASAYLSKGAQPDLLCRAIIHVKQHGFFIGDLAKKEYFENHPTSALKKGAYYGHVTLSPKEVEFMRLTATDYTIRK